MLVHGSSPSLTVLIVDDSRTVQMMMNDIISAAEDMRVVGTAMTGQDGIRRALELQPDVILLDINLPDSDGIQVAWALTPKLPNTSIIMATSEDSTAMMQRAMLAGAQGYITKPLSPAVVLETIRNVRGRHLERVTGIIGSGRLESETMRPQVKVEAFGRRVAVFGAKGGVGKTVIAVNLAVALRVRTGKEVALVDGDFYFGDLALHLNIASKATIMDLLSRVDEMDGSLLRQVMAVHPTGLKVLAPPPRPEQAELVHVDHLKRLLTALPTFYDYTVLDCHNYYDDRMLALLDHADLILLVMTPEIGTVRNSKHFLRLADSMGYSRDRVLPVLNRSDSNVGLSIGDVERALEVDHVFTVPSGGRAVASSVNEGKPLVLENPRSPVPRAILEIAQQVEILLAART